MTFKVIPRERLLTNGKLTPADQERIWVMYCRFVGSVGSLHAARMEDVLDALMQAYIEGRDRTHCGLGQNP